MARIMRKITFDETRQSPYKQEKKNILQLGEGGPPRAPPARTAARSVDRSGGCRPPNPLAVLLFFCTIMVEFCCIPEHVPEALVAAIRSSASLRFGCT